MPELWTVPLDRGVFDVMVGRLRVAPGKQMPRNMIGVVTLKGRTLPLTGYEMAADETIYCTTPLPVASEPSMLYAILVRLSALSDGVSSTLYLAPSGRHFNVDEDSDVNLALGRDSFESYVSVNVGKYSDASNDLAARAQLFNLMSRCAGLTDGAAGTG
jgi:hypothetical protein